MPQNAIVTINYGPYESCGLVDHRTSRLEGLEALLTGDGHKVVFKQIEDWNTVELIVNGELIFKCDQRDLDYGGDGQLDEQCHQALEAVRKAY
ncbi:UPF0728 protein C10orf53 homolog [Ptychodera flava]|uniref:UPF0728 protein C10orf53 homolog n=1 Tax=Ptychodera flava TaxID=63121 RepID=UPI00396A79CD